MERTHEQEVVYGTWLMYGPEQFVFRLARRVGSDYSNLRKGGWVVEFPHFGRVPKVFKTKREAVAHADAAARELTRPGR